MHDIGVGIIIYSGCPSRRLHPDELLFSPLIFFLFSASNTTVEFEQADVHDVAPLVKGPKGSSVLVEFVRGGSKPFKVKP